MDVIEAMHSRRSTRAFTPEPLPREVVAALIWDAAQAPPPFAGEVPWTFNVIEGVDRIAGYGALARQYARDHRPAGAAWNWTEREDLKVFWDAPVVVIISGPAEDCCRAGAFLILSAHGRGLGACWVGAPMLWLRTEAAKAEIGIPAGLTPIAAICVGHPASAPEPRERARPTVIWHGP